jgi:hypothetical protein
MAPGTTVHPEMFGCTNMLLAVADALLGMVNIDLLLSLRCPHSYYLMIQEYTHDATKILILAMPKGASPWAADWG